MGPGASALSVSHDVITAAMKVHTALGPGLLESAYEACLAHELRRMGHQCETQVALPVVYDSVRLEAGYRIDLLVDDLVVVELKAVERVLDVHYAQMIAYLKLSDRDLGLLINFNVRHLKNGVKRFVRGTLERVRRRTHPRNLQNSFVTLRG